MELSRNAKLLKFFAQQYPGVPRKRLVKLAYMADILARECLGRPISEFVYIKDHYGPNDRDLLNVVKELEELGLVHQVDASDGQFRWIRLRDTGKPIVFDFTPAENEILGFVVQNYMNMQLDEFIEQVVKPTDPFQLARHEGEVLPMHVVDNVMRNEIGFDLEAVTRAEKEAEDGHHVTLGKFLDGLRDQITSRHAE